jgi:hypothetical protein
VSSLFGNWLLRLGKNIKSQTRVGICALRWTIWHLRNDFIFNKLKHASFLQVILLDVAGGAPLEHGILGAIAW